MGVDYDWRWGVHLFLGILVGVMLLLTAEPLFAATITATSCSSAHVGDAVNQAVNGDTVLIPAGRCTWTKNLKITGKYFTLQGAGIDKTIVVDGVSKASYPNIPQVIWWNSIAGGLSRLSGITFEGGTITDGNNKGMVAFEGSSHSFRIDHTKFIPTRTAGLIVRGNLWGVIDHSTFDMSARNGYGLFVHGEGYGDKAWAEGATLGTERNVFVEDNLFTQDRTKGHYYTAIDGWTGHRLVVRKNRFEAVKVANHGTETSGRWRSARQYEYYNNTWVWNMYTSATPTVPRNAYPALIGIRGGTGVIYNNTATITNGSVSNVADFNYLRTTNSYSPWGKCQNSWDLSAIRCLDQPGVGQGQLISGATPTPVGWPQEVNDPVYVWNNQINGVSRGAVSRSLSVVQVGRDVLHQPKPGYKPYVYPHPLVSGSSQRRLLVAPSGLSPFR